MEPSKGAQTVLKALRTRWGATEDLEQKGKILSALSMRLDSMRLDRKALEDDRTFKLSPDKRAEVLAQLETDREAFQALYNAWREEATRDGLYSVMTVQTTESFTWTFVNGDAITWNINRAQGLAARRIFGYDELDHAKLEGVLATGEPLTPDQVAHADLRLPGIVVLTVGDPVAEAKGVMYQPVLIDGHKRAAKAYYSNQLWRVVFLYPQDARACTMRCTNWDRLPLEIKDEQLL